MRSALLKAASLALVILHAATVARAGVDVRTVFDDNGHVVVQLDNHQPPNMGVSVNFFVAISPSGSYSAKFTSGPALVAGKGAHAQAVAALDTLTLSSPFQFRGSRVLWVKVQIPPNTPVSNVEVTYTPAATVRSEATVDPLVRELVVNQTVRPPTRARPGVVLQRPDGQSSVTNRGVPSPAPISPPRASTYRASIPRRCGCTRTAASTRRASSWIRRDRGARETRCAKWPCASKTETTGPSSRATV
jgi:hypothetical protein